MEIYRDSREEVWHRVDDRTIGLLYEKYIRHSFVFEEIMPGYFALELELEGFADDLIRLIKKNYMFLFRKEILSIPLGKDFAPIFFDAKSPTVLGQLANRFKRNFIISCQQCHTIFLIERGFFPLESLYQKMESIHREEKQSKSIGFCSKRKDFLCSKCQPIVNCSLCRQTFGKDMVSPGSRKCRLCFHRPSPPLSRCFHKNHQKKSYQTLRECCLCQDLVCEFDSIFLSESEKAFCLTCLRHGYNYDIILDCEDSVEAFVMAWSIFESKPLTRKGKQCIDSVSHYIEVFRGIPKRKEVKRRSEIEPMKLILW